MVIGVGNALRGDDAAGLEVVRRVDSAPGLEPGLEPGIECRAHDGEAIELLELWTDADAVVLVDTVRSGAAAGTVHHFDVSAEPLPLTLRRGSSHTIGIGEAIELARTLGRLPPRVMMYGVEGTRFAAGEPLSDEVAAAASSLASEVLAEARALLRPPPSESR